METSEDRPPEDPVPPAPANPFDVGEPTDDELATTRKANKRRIALIGVATGGLMALLVLACIGLLVAAQNS